MKMDLGPLHVTKVIVHEVPNRIIKGGGGQVVYSQIESDLDAGLRNYFREKIIASLGSAGYQVVFDPSSSSPVPDLLSDYLEGTSVDFVGMSKDIADHLYQSQTGVNSSGLLCVVQVAVGNMVGIAILKLDKEAAVRIEPVTLQGNSTYDLEHVRNLILSQRTRVFKAGIFVGSVTANKSIEVEGTVSDNQRGYAPSTEVADFFLKRFLGCKLLESPDFATKQFFHVTEGFIATDVPNPETKAQYETALLAELNSQQGIVNPLDFSEKHLLLEDRQKYLDRLSQNSVSFQQFEKDTELIKTHLRRISVDFESGVGVLVPPGAFDRQVTMSNLDDGRTHLQVRDKLTRMKGK